MANSQNESVPRNVLYVGNQMEPGLSFTNEGSGQGKAQTAFPQTTQELKKRD